MPRPTVMPSSCRKPWPVTASTRMRAKNPICMQNQDHCGKPFNSSRTATHRTATQKCMASVLVSGDTVLCAYNTHDAHHACPAVDPLGVVIEAKARGRHLGLSGGLRNFLARQRFHIQSIRVESVLLMYILEYREVHEVHPAALTMDYPPSAA